MLAVIWQYSENWVTGKEVENAILHVENATFTCIKLSD